MQTICSGYTELGAGQGNLGVHMNLVTLFGTSKSWTLLTDWAIISHIPNLGVEVIRGDSLADFGAFGIFLMGKTQRQGSIYKI